MRAKKPKRVCEDDDDPEIEERRWWKLVPEEEWKKFKPAVTWSSERFQQV